MVAPALSRLTRARVVLLVAVGFAALTAVACGSSGDVAPTATVAQSSPSEGSFAGFEENQHDWTVVSYDLDVVLATPDLGVGAQRFALVLSDSQGLVKFPVIELNTYRYPDGFASDREGPVETKLARFTLFPFGTRGIHVTEFDFDSAGAWSVEANVPRSDGTEVQAEVRFRVMEEPASVNVGEPAPPSKNRTLSDVSDIAELTTGSHHDEELYRLTIAEAIEMERPFVVVFASPAFCTNAVCGPQVEVVSDLRETYSDGAEFIHVDLFENPQEIQGDLSRAVETDLLEEWGLVSQEWTYVVDADGVVAARFENFVGAGELAEAIESVLESDGNA